MMREHLIHPVTEQQKVAWLERNILNFEEKDDPTPIYRVMHIERLLEILSQRKLCLRQPLDWDDPFENYIIKKCSELRKLHFPATIYGQCWSLKPETDAMWRIYSPEKHGVKVKTTVRKLFSQLCNSEEVKPAPYLSCFIGKVRYVCSDEIRDLNEQVVQIVSGEGVSHNIPIAKTLLMKRGEFTHEAEVRLIYLDLLHSNEEVGKAESDNCNFQKKSNGDAFEFKIDTVSLIEEIVLDPRMNDYSCAAYENFIRSLGYCGPLYKSSLYSIE